MQFSSPKSFNLNATPDEKFFLYSRMKNSSINSARKNNHDTLNYDLKTDYNNNENEGPYKKGRAYKLLTEEIDDLNNQLELKNIEQLYFENTYNENYNKVTNELNIALEKIDKFQKLLKIYEEKFEKLSKKKKILKNTLIDKEDLIRQKAAEINNLEAKLNRKPLFDINETRSLEINEYKKENENLKARLFQTQKEIQNFEKKGEQSKLELDKKFEIYQYKITDLVDQNNVIKKNLIESILRELGLLKQHQIFLDFFNKASKNKDDLLLCEQSFFTPKMIENSQEIINREVELNFYKKDLDLFDLFNKKNAGIFISLEELEQKIPLPSKESLCCEKDLMQMMFSQAQSLEGFLKNRIL